jgi:DNA-binding NtrC family response regulator
MAKKQQPKILIVDDEKAIRYVLRDILEAEEDGYVVDEAQDGEEALRLISEKDYDAVLCDVKMPKVTGIEVLEKAQEMGKDTQFIMISAHGDIDTAIEAIKKGAFDFITKPPDLQRILVSIRNAIDKSFLVVKTKTLQQQLSKTFDIIGESEAIQLVKQDIEKVGPTEARVLITGPNGSGKELVAKWIHARSNRSKGPLIEVNCAAIPAELIESELFGHEKGAFTSAVKQRIGKFEQADNGTLFLDEIGDMSLSAQAKVLRALQEHKITRVGGDKEIKVNVRVLAATNKNLREEIAHGHFREDLYHRLGVIIIQVPPLKDRKEDLPLLIDKFLTDIAKEYGEAKKRVSPEAVARMQEYDWTGNVRELRNVVERLIILGGAEISVSDVERYL